MRSPTIRPRWPHFILGLALLTLVAVTQRDTAAQPKNNPKAKAKGAPKGPVAMWIWGADNAKNYSLRTTIKIDEPASAVVKASCDNKMTLLINGKEVAKSNEWQEPVDLNVSKFLNAGENTIQANVANEGGAAGFVLRLVVTSSKGEQTVFVSDETWQAFESPSANKGVAVRTVGKHGDQPWGQVFNAQAGVGAKDGQFQLPPGFQIEKLYTVPKATQGSWVNITTDPKGRLIVSDQGNLGLYRVTPPKMGTKEETKVEKLNVNSSGAQGLLFAFDSLYVVQNGGPGGSGLYRLRDTKGNDQFDEVVKIKAFQGGGEHGPHAIRLTPDGKGLYVICGNHTLPPQSFDSSRVPKNWDEDHLLPRQWDANGHARGILAPGGWVAKTDPDGKTWEMFTIGYRNPFDFALNADGEMFVYDADMEWDLGAPWYRPTRVNHATSGSELGWRSGTGKWPSYYLDSLPAMVDIGPGSPVGVTFGYGAKFPAKYQKALYILDWTFGTIYAIHTEPDGSSYKATKEEFVSRTPLPLTDATIGADGAFYFLIGGRGTQSELFRVTYTGMESTEKVEYKETRNVAERELRHKLEAYHKPATDMKAAVEFIYPNLNSKDRFIRYAARVALEHQKPETWQDRVLSETDPERLLNGAVALARQGDKALQSKLLAALEKLEFGKLSEAHQLDLLRVYGLVFLRMGEPSKEAAAKIAKTLDAYYPAKSDFVTRELCQVLVYLKSPTVIAKTVELLKQPSKPTPQPGMQDVIARNKGYGAAVQRMLDNAPDQQKVSLLFWLRNAKEGWTMDQRTVFFNSIAEARKWSGGNSYLGFLNNMEKDAYDNATDVERLAIEAAGLRKPFKPKELPKPAGPGKEWKLAEVLAMESKLKGRNFANGQKTFASARCVVCHRFYGEGGATGPDLTQSAGRFSYKDMAESILEPNKVISDQYKAFVVRTLGGKTYTGKLVSDTPKGVVILTDPEDSTKVVEVKRSDVDEVKPSPVSLMPADLMKSLNENEVLDLMAYLLSRGDPNHAMFKK